MVYCFGALYSYLRNSCTTGTAPTVSIIRDWLSPLKSSAYKHYLENTKNYLQHFLNLIDICI